MPAVTSGDGVGGCASLAYVTVFFSHAELLVKLKATSDDEEDQAVLGALLIFFIFSGPLVLAFLTFRDFLRAGRCFVESTEESSDVDALAATRESSLTRPLPADRPPRDYEEKLGSTL